MNLLTSRPPYLHKLSPYIPLSEYGELDATDIESVLLRDVLKDTVIRQLDYAKAKLEHQQFRFLPKPLESLAQENSHVLPNVFNMLNAFEWFMKDAKHADVRETLSIVFHPMIVWVQGFRCVTSPALLVLQSILFSHCDSREETSEQYSAVRAFEELMLMGFPENDCRFITAIIAHQTLLRAAWTVDPKRDPAEVIAYYIDDNEPKLAEGEERYPMVGLALQRTLFPFLENKGIQQEELSDNKKMRRRQLAAALILHSLCLQCRHSRYVSELFPAIKIQALHFMHYLLASSSRKAGLGFFHYLRYACQGGASDQGIYLSNETKEWFRKCLIIKLSKEPNNNDPINITLCFPRVPSKRFWLKENFNTIGDHIKPKLDERSDTDNERWKDELIEPGTLDAVIKVIDLVGATVGDQVFRYEIKNPVFLLRALGLVD